MLSGHIRPYPADMETEEEQARMQSLREFWSNYMEEQKEKLGLNNPLTMEQIQKNLDLIEQGKIKFASEDCWSDETKKYNEAFEDDLEDYSIFDSLTLWGGEEDND